MPRHKRHDFIVLLMSFTPAKTIASSQPGMHSALAKTLLKHVKTRYQKPIAEHTRQVFEQAYDYWQRHDFSAVYLDSACGTAESTRFLAAQNPNALVIGLDQSLKRLSHSANKTVPDNCLVLRCDCTDFWRLAEQQQWCFQFHSLFYPNPYPKPDDLKKRWHGHPAFVSLLAISEKIELRTNWKIYAEEFYFALQMLGTKKIELKQYINEQSITAFERKYQKSGHDLWQVVL